MKLKKETHYSIKAIRVLYRNREIKLLTAKEIAEIEDIPVKFLYPILRKLNKENLIIIERGINGGYRAAKHLEHTTLYDLLILMEDDISLSFCKSSNDCSKSGCCNVSDALSQVDDGIRIALNNIKLIDII